jgi:hypothetical protein
MSCFRRNIVRDGTSQTQRLLPSSDPATVQVDDRNIEMLLQFISDFAKQVAYRNFSNLKEGDWTPLVASAPSAIKKAIALLALSENGANPEAGRNLPPQQVILLIFIRLFTYLQQDLNNVAKRHLAYYYSRILQFALQNATPDKVHVLFELNKQVRTFKIENESLLFAGKDEEGRDQLYRMTREVVINQAIIGEIRTLFVNASQQPRLIQSKLNSELLQALADDQKRWKPFGVPTAIPSAKGQPFEPATTGWAIASPLLNLRSGKRSVSIKMLSTAPATITLSDGSAVAVADTLIAQYLKVELSTATAWIEIPLTLGMFTKTPTGGETNLGIEIAADLPPIVSPAFDSSLGSLVSWPVLRCNLQPETPEIIYLLFQSLEIKSIELGVGATEVKDISVYNDFGPVDPGKPFQPFGAIPRPGTTFYIGSPEIFNKKLSSLEIGIQWTNVPQASLPNYYRGYFKTTGGLYLKTGQPDPPGPEFTATMEQLVAGQWKTISIANLSLFDGSDATQPVSFKTNTVDNQLDLQYFITQPAKVAGELPAPSQSQDGYIAMRLQQTALPVGFSTGIKAFGHDEFPIVLSEIAIGKANKVPDFDNVSFPNQPYTPVVKQVSLNYTATETTDLASSDQTAKFFHFEPFGVQERTGTTMLIPTIAREGYIFIGLDKLTPPQNISFLFQLEEGTNEPDQALRSEDIQWSYLAGDKWETLDRQSIIADTTRGFQASGIIELSIGESATLQHSLMPPGLHWIRGYVASGAASASDVVAVYTQAAVAEYIAPELPEEVLNLDDLEVKPIDLAEHILPENSISRLIDQDQAVKTIRQPYPSFDGSSVENLRSFYARVSERLRHRNRPVGIWDYERVVLQAFPDIYKVKCLPHTDPTSKPVANQAPGHVTLVVVPSFFGRVQRILEPRANSITLIRIKEYLEGSASPQAAIHVINPVYERIMLDFKVGFYEGKDPGYYSKVLNEELVKFLSPWAFDSSREIIFGGSFTRSDVIDFIEKRDYVDFVTELYMYSSAIGPGCPGIEEMLIITGPAAPIAPLDFTVREITAPGIGVMSIEDTFIIGEPLEVLSASSDLSIIVSAEQHIVRPVQKNVCTILPGIGIGAWFIEIDFEVQNN